MILILSSSEFQTSIDKVVEWLKYYDYPFIRINGLNDEELTYFKYDINQLCIEINGVSVDFSQIGAVWFYRWGSPNNYGTLKLHKNLEKQFVNIDKHLKSIKEIINGIFFIELQKKYFLSERETSSLNKLRVLKLAQDYGLKIPDTLFTNSLKEINLFKHKDIIVKPSSELMQFEFDNNLYSSMTSLISEVEINQLSNNFEFVYPTLVQSKVEKKFEIRIFYINECFYSMAIFSQNDNKTKIDFRNYNENRPNRNIPFKLPKRIEKKLLQLIKRVELKTCSIDMIYNTNNEFIFLEINPVGQFGMTSNPCNYNLDKIIAEKLIYEDEKYLRK